MKKRNFEENTLKELEKLYPNRVLVGLSVDQKKLYNRLTAHAKENNMCISEYLSGKGFELQHKTKIPKIRIDFEGFSNYLTKLLAEHYPDKKIVAISSTYRTAYGLLKEYSKFQDLSLKKASEELGFQYVGLDEETREKEFWEEINRLFPDKKISSFARHRKLRARAGVVAKNTGISLLELLSSEGYEWVSHQGDYKPKKKKSEESLAKLKDFLKDTYPDNLIRNMNKIDINQYLRFIRLSKQLGLTLDEFAASLGYKNVSIYNDSDEEVQKMFFNQRKQKLLEELQGTFGKKVVYQHIDYKMLKKIRNYAEGKSIIEFLKDNNFEVIDISDEIKKEKDYEKTQYVLSKLQELFPDKIVRRLKTDHDGLYKRIQRLARLENKSMSEYLRKHGYVYAKPMPSRRFWNSI